MNWRIPSHLILQAILFFFLNQNVRAQNIARDIISSGGESVSTGNLLLAYNIGEPVTELLSNPVFGSLSIGFIQSDANSLLPIAVKNISQELVIYPNPTVGGIAKLDIKNIPDGKYQIDIIDALGRILFTQTVAYTKNNKINFDLNIERFKGGTYYVRVKNESIQGHVKLVKL
ncbi:T9SS type A sorting domain-containing protein [Pedobacter frigidisoli]|uniref:T9SS type A sorting domain-containing protein n=1 Tax=Pedobacter frigidisoli TaxID=2530455 RepID=UPI00292D7B94|nr:T9SS type A sorting domain-containing protein [Pedobacter frigidisoli]